MGISRPPKAPRLHPTSAIFFTERSQKIVIISEGFFIFSLLSLQGPSSAVQQVLQYPFLYPSLLPKSSNFFFFFLKKENHKLRASDMVHMHGALFLPQKRNCPNPASAASQIQIEHKPELPHLTNLIRAISSLPWRYTAKSAVTATLGEVCKAISVVVYLQAVDKTNVPEIAAGFEGVFPNCTGTICHREH